MENTSDIQNDIINRLRTLRKERGISQEQLASACNLSKSMISKLETNRGTFNLDILVRICSALNISMGEFLDVPSQKRKHVLVIQKSNQQRLASGVPGKQGYVYYKLADQPDKLNAMCIEIHKEALAHKRFVRHEGHEFLSVVEGEIMLSFREEEYILSQGDTAFFDGGIEHKVLPHNCDFAKLTVLFIHI